MALLFLRNFASASLRMQNSSASLRMQNFAKIKQSQNGETSPSFSDVCKSCSSCEFLMSQIFLLKLFFVKIKLLRIFFFDFTVFNLYST